MISALWLILIVPVSAFVGFLVCAMCVAASRGSRGHYDDY